MIPERYNRIQRLSDISDTDLLELKKARVALVGCGTLGGAYGPHLVRLGIGHLKLIDRDIVEEHNLSTQYLFTERHILEPTPKVLAARESLKSINADCQIDCYPSELNPKNAESILNNVDLIIDATDNFETRFLINDIAFKNGIPWIYTGVIGYSGVSMAFLPGKTACLKCLIDEPPDAGTLETCETSGVWPPAAQVITGIGITEAIRILTGKIPAYGFSELDLQTGTWKKLNPGRKDDCHVCTHRQFSFLQGTSVADTVKLCGRDMVHISPKKELDLDLSTISRKLPPDLTVVTTIDLLQLKLDGVEIYLFRDGRAFVKGVSDISQARSIYSRYFST